ncbi:hypothetical protein RhiirA5_408126 [Rhizophagus irregularis]|uniref:Uncharacterized protein n=2 Tax=Rhizophagus irregularis TaxID=588596 RepID=A0A2N0Q8V4_9GLOM|nr:hypothetical protein RhiirA5_408126 [Rhizophagus irregularis]GBC34776.1 hypothetical protein GLOIN_2v1773065 [Rhizophagus irregularis DAOM 181602=DAOM 197198]CAB5196279.1 unnamed protein product [Rhizophagus irregularis]
MLNEIFTFELLSLDKFVSSYQNTTTLAPKALEYRSVVISSGNMVHANSNWYSQPIFDNILINIMDSSEIEDYTTYDGLCFEKINLTSQYEFISVDSVVE